METGPILLNPSTQDGFVQPAEEPVEDNTSLVEQDEQQQTYGYDDYYEDEQEEY